jgi:hypothetical protein
MSLTTHGNPIDQEVDGIRILGTIAWGGEVTVTAEPSDPALERVEHAYIVIGHKAGPRDAVEAAFVMEWW